MASRARADLDVGRSRVRDADDGSRRPAGYGPGVPALPVPDPPLVDPGGRFVMRPWAVGDAVSLALAWQDPQIAEWCTVPAGASLPAAARWIAGWAERVERGLALDLVAADLETDDVIGECGIRRLARPASRPGPEIVEIGWWIAEPHRGLGLAASAARLLSEWAVETLGDQVVARIPTGHAPSERIAATAGFQRRGDLPTGFTLWAARPPG